jgi:cytochrome c oxidase subunit 2
MSNLKRSLGVMAIAGLGFANSAFAGWTIPIPGTDVAARWDTLYLFLVWLSIFFFVLVVGAMLVFIVKYRHRPGVKTQYITGNHLLEAFWIIIPTIMLLAIFGWGYSVYRSMISAPADAYEIRVIGKQWLWQFQYDSGRTTTAELYVPLNRPVKLIMTSQDVLHDFFIPNFRIKQDVVPGMYTSVWFEARVPGKHQIFCSQYCGTSHSGMLAKLIVLDDKQWKDWQNGKKIENIPDASDEYRQEQMSENDTTTPARSTAEAQSDAKNDDDTVANEQASTTLKPMTLVQQGKNLFEVKGCASCHSVDGTSKIGPTEKGIFGKTVTLTDGSTVMRDENYIRESIEQPNAKIVKGFNPVMPTFQGLLSETEMNSLIAYIKSLK